MISRSQKLIAMQITYASTNNNVNNKVFLVKLDSNDLRSAFFASEIRLNNLLHKLKLLLIS